MTVEIAGAEQASEASSAQPVRNQDKQARYLKALNATRSTGLRPGHATGHVVGRTSRQREMLKHAFLETYSRYGNIGQSCDLVGISRATFYQWQEHDPEFSLAFQQAEKRALETLEQEAWRRAVEGSPYTRTSYYRGEPVGTDHKIEYSDQLLTLLLRAKAPERYREKVDLAVSQVIKTVAGVDPSTVL